MITNSKKQNVGEKEDKSGGAEVGTLLLNRELATTTEPARPTDAVQALFTTKPGRASYFSARILVIVAALLAINVNNAFAQGIALDAAGHCLSDDKAVFACWNFQAGTGSTEDITAGIEFLPNLRGWDFRINLPHVRFQRIRNGPGTPISMVGVVEDARPLDLPPTVNNSLEYGHRSNSIWLLREERGRVFFSQLPSRRDLNGNQVQNTASLTNSWSPIGDANAPNFQSFRIAAAVAGRGLNDSTVHVVAVDNAFGLWHNSIRVDRTNITSWPSTWQPLNANSRGAASLAPVGGNSVALAWVDRSNNLLAQLFNPANNTWGAPVIVARAVDPFSPWLVWDGTTLHLIFSAGNRLRHSFRLPGNTLAFSQSTIVSSFLPVFQGQFDAMAFNGGVHIVVRTQTGEPANSAVFYTTTKSPSGSAAAWTIPSETGLKASSAPRIASLQDNVFVVVTSTSGRITYARKDPNALDNRITGGALADRWLDSGLDVDARTGGSLGNPELLTFNADLYLTANLKPGFVDGSAQIMNLGRAAIKHLITSKWRINLLYGGGGNALPTPFGGAGEIRLIGDFDGNRRSDVIRFTQKNAPGVGPAPVFVRRVISGLDFSPDELWHRFFSLKDEIPLVGDFSGDGKDDIVTFTQKQQFDASGSLIGNAPVWVAVSNGSAFGTSSVWHTFFSLKGEIPLVGDFNGDGKKDIITFTQQLQRNADGSIIGQAPVWVALSTGTSFGAGRVWHTFFSLKGEIPMVGDFNGDGKDDIATFVQKPHRDASSNVIAQAPVWVALSDGTRFGQSRIWHNFFSPRGELPRVGDLNMDGKADIVTFLQGAGQGLQARNVITAFSNGTRFETSTMFASDQVRKGDLPSFGSFSALTLGLFTGNPNDMPRLFPDLYIFQPNGNTIIASAMGTIPFSTGAPWERYKWFTEKGLGVAYFPEWIYETRPGHCISPQHRFILGGSGGSGGGDTTTLSVRIGSRAEHVLEELGHSVFANCLRQNADPFQIFNLIYKTPMPSGLDANNLPGCGAFDDCRDPEHFFLQLIKRYRLYGDAFRDAINNDPDFAVRRRRHAQYVWLKQHWYRGAEFKSGPSRDPTMMTTYGLLCLPGECAIVTPPPPPPPPPPTREQCLADCRAELNLCIKGRERPQVCAAQAKLCRADCPP